MYEYLGKKVLYSTVLAAILVLGGCSGSDGDNSGGTTVETSGSLSGKVVDGYIANGDVFADINADGINNTGDIVTVTDALGDIVPPAEAIPFNTYVYVTGGTDLATGRAFTGRMSAFYTGDALVVSPLSTMVAVLTKAGQSPAEATTSVAAALGVTAEQVSADPMQDTEVFFAAQRIVSAIEVFSEHTDGNVTAESFEAAVAALAENEMDFNATAADLGVPAEAAAQATVVDELVQDIEVVVTEAIASGAEADLESYQTVVADIMDDVIDQIANDPTATVEVPAVNNVQLLSDAVACIIFDVIKGSNTVATNITSNLVLSGADSCLEQSDGNVTLVWSVDNALALDASGIIQPGIYAQTNVVLSVAITTDNADAETVEKTFALTLPRLDNRAPVANNVTASVNEDGEVIVDINASDEDGDTLSVTISTAPANGVAVVENGQVKYTPAANFNGSDVISYTVTDNWTSPATSSAATITVTVNPVDDAPVLEPIANPAPVSEDSGSFTVNLVANDVDSDPISYTVTSSNEAIVIVSESGAVVTVTPVLNASGVVTIDVNATANGQSSLQSFDVTILAVNDAPVLDPVANPAAMDEDASALAIVLSGSDVDGDPISYSAVSLDDTIVVASVSGTTLTLTPVTDASGSATVTITATANAQSVEQNITVTINAVDDAPVLAAFVPVNLDEDSGDYIVTPSATDVDNDNGSIIYSLVSSDTNVLTVSGTTLTTIADASGIVEVNVTATSNGLTDSETLLVSVNAVDDAPVLAAITPITVSEDHGLLTITPSATDVDNEDGLITYSYVSSDTNLLTVSGTDVSTVPDADGVTTITVTAISNGLTGVTDVNVTVTAVNDAPTANDFTLPITTSSTGNIIDLGSHIDDVDGDALTVTVFDPLTGLSHNTGTTTFTYDNDGSEGQFSFGFTVEDADGVAASATVTLNVSTEPVVPVANDDTATTDEEVTVNIDVLANDVNATSVSAAWVPTAENGSVVVELDNTITFTPATDRAGVFIVKYTAISSTGHEDNGTVSVTVADVNDAPVVTILTPTPLNLIEADFDRVELIDLNVTDIDTLSAISVGGFGGNGGIEFHTISDTQAELFIAANSNGNVVMTLTASDGEAGGDTEISFAVNVTAVDSAAVIGLTDVSVDLLNGAMHYPLDVQPFDETYALTIENPGDANVATFSISGNELVVDPIGSGDTVITVRAVNDANSSLETFADINIQVYDGSNTPPVADNSEFSVEVDGSAYTQLSVNDMESNELTFIMVTPPAHGDIVSFNSWDGTATYVATDAYIGDDSFTFKVNDGFEDSNIATVTVHVIPSPHVDNNDNDMPLTLEDFDALTAQTIPSTPMYEVEEEGWDNQSELYTMQIRFDEPSLTIFGVDNFGTAMEEAWELAYTLDTDDTTALLNFPETVHEVDEKLRFVGTVTGADLATDLSITLPDDAVGYKMAFFRVVEEYDEWDDNDPEYRNWDCNESGCVGSDPYGTLDEYMTDKTFDPANPGWSTIWIDGYEFKFAQDSNLSDGAGVANGTIIRTVRYYDHDLGQEVEVVTNADAGSWELVNADGKDRIKVTPAVYSIDEVRTYQVTDNGMGAYVYQGEYRPANQGEMGYWFDENTMYHIGNSVMNRSAGLPSANLLDGSASFISFNNLPTATLPIDTSMYGIWAWDDMNGYMIDVDELRFDNNGTFSIVESEGGFSAEYIVSNEVATLLDPDSNPFVDAKLVEIITDAAELSGLIDINVSYLPASPIAYKFTHINYNAEFDAWGEDIVAFDDTRYTSYADFEVAFMAGELALDYTPNGGIGIASGVAGEGGTLAEYDGPPPSNVINANAGTWKVVTIGTESVMVFNITVDRLGDHDAIGLPEDGGNVSKGRYSAADSGNVEYRYDATTRDAIVSYLQDQNSTYDNQINFEIEIPIMREVQSVAFTNNKMYDVLFDINQTTCERSVSTEYNWLNGDSASGSFVMSDNPQTYTYVSSDGEIATINDGTSDVFLTKVNEELNATQLMSETGLFLPISAHGYRISYMDLATGQGGTSVKLDDVTIGYLESYYNNNHMLDGMCGVPAP